MNLFPQIPEWLCRLFVVLAAIGLGVIIFAIIYGIIWLIIHIRFI